MRVAAAGGGGRALAERQRWEQRAQPHSRGQTRVASARAVGGRGGRSCKLRRTPPNGRARPLSRAILGSPLAPRPQRLSGGVTGMQPPSHGGDGARRRPTTRNPPPAPQRGCPAPPTAQRIAPSWIGCQQLHWRVRVSVTPLRLGAGGPPASRYRRVRTALANALPARPGRGA